MSAIVWCRLCGHKCVSHTPTGQVPAHAAPWNRTQVCPGTNLPGLRGVA